MRLILSRTVAYGVFSTSPYSAGGSTNRGKERSNHPYRTGPNSHFRKAVRAQLSTVIGRTGKDAILGGCSSG